MFNRLSRKNPQSAIRNPQLRSGFTLIELLVVIAIISLLVSILVPSLNMAKELAKGVVCMSNLKHVGLSTLLYSEEWSGYAPPAWNDSTKLTWSEVLYGNDYIVQPEVGQSTVFRCPSRNGQNWQTRTRTYGMAMNLDIVNLHYMCKVIASPVIYVNYVNGNIRETGLSSSDFFLFADSIGSPGFLPDREQHYYINNAPPPGDNHNLHLRHSEKANLFFLDGHVSAWGPDQLADAEWFHYIDEDFVGH